LTCLPACQQVRQGKGKNYVKQGLAASKYVVTGSSIFIISLHHIKIKTFTD
jgi:hypothetical protein